MAEFTANVWKLFNFQTLKLRYYTTEFDKKSCLLIGTNKDTVYSKQKELIRAITTIIKILKLQTITL